MYLFVKTSLKMTNMHILMHIYYFGYDS